MMPVKGPGALAVGAIAGRVEELLSRFLRERLDRRPDLADLIHTLTEFVLGGGKRVRPALCYWAWRASGGQDEQPMEKSIVAAAASLELLHACALIHDDVIDGSTLRRFRPSVHRRLTALHVERGWRGDAGAFGVSVAIVAGDLCMVWADELVRHSGLAPAALERGWPVYDTMREETIRGQYLDLVIPADGIFDAAQAWQVAESKTAASTTSGPLLFGAALAGASAELQASLADFGRALGVAFQLRDDLAGAFGDPTITGKPSGDDLRDGKATLLLAEAQRRAGEDGSLVIDDLLARGEVSELRTLLESTGARTGVERLIERLTAEALAAIDGAPIVDESARDVLRGLALALTR